MLTLMEMESSSGPSPYLIGAVALIIAIGLIAFVWSYGNGRPHS